MGTDIVDMDIRVPQNSRVVRPAKDFAHYKPLPLRNIKLDILDNILLCCIKVSLYTVHRNIIRKNRFHSFKDFI